MAKQVHDDAMDAGLNYLADSADQLDLVTQAPSSFEDVATYSKGSVAITPGVGNGDFTLDDGVVSGRRLILAQQSVPGTGAGTATHAVLTDQGSSKILQVTTAPNYLMENGVNQVVPSYDVWEIKDPT